MSPLDVRKEAVKCRPSWIENKFLDSDMTVRKSVDSMRCRCYLLELSHFVQRKNGTLVDAGLSNACSYSPTSLRSYSATSLRWSLMIHVSIKWFLFVFRENFTSHLHTTMDDFRSFCKRSDLLIYNIFNMFKSSSSTIIYFLKSDVIDASYSQFSRSWFVGPFAATSLWLDSGHGCYLSGARYALS